MNPFPMSPEHAVLGAMLACAAGALLTLACRRRPALGGWTAFAAAAASSLLALGGAARVLAAGPGPALTVLGARPLEFGLRLHVDGLSAIFLGVIAAVTLPAALYSIDFMRRRHHPGTGHYYPPLLLFIAAMYGIVSTTDMMWFFFIFWQLMTLAGFVLIRFERDRPGTARAANRYLLMMQLACALTMIGAGLLARTGVTTGAGETLMRYDFDAVTRHLPAQLRFHPLGAATAFALFLAGFGIKLGMWPFGQFWLPDAHPAAPSPVSALLSGVMIKTGVYGLMRCFLWLVPAEAQADYPAAGWGALMVLLGTITLAVGTVQALQQNHTKRLLAFSSIGQAGYILLGLGVCLTLVGSADPAIRALAVAGFCGALFHVINHSLFKSLLFLNAGSVLHATGTQDMNQLGGLLRFMPATALSALVASAAIAGVPLSSGFASKWSIFLGAIQGHPAAWWLPLAATIAILTSAVTLALMTKFYGAVFLTRASSLVLNRAAQTRQPGLDVPTTMKLAQAALATLCLGFGLLPAAGFGLVDRALQASRQGLGTVLADAAPVTAGAWTGVGGAAGQAVYAPLLVLLVLGLAFAFARLLARAGGAPRRAAAPWLCGYATAHEMNRYRASHFYADIQRHLEWAGGRLAPPPAPEPATPPPTPAQPELLPWSLEKDSPS
ncbi:MAG: peroxiredoxin family protein [Verrucomicrobia bacterium]|nr:peroxiredoxin family protein [Verrucomicrobiota bacterium]